MSDPMYVIHLQGEGLVVARMQVPPRIGEDIESGTVRFVLKNDDSMYTLAACGPSKDTRLSTPMLIGGLYGIRRWAQVPPNIEALFDAHPVAGREDAR